MNDAATVAEDSGATAIPVLANDTDPDGGPKTITAKTNSGHGTVTITGGGTGLTYQPAPNYCGPDTFTYTLNGGSSATVTMAVTCLDDGPVAVDDSATMVEDAAATAIDVLANDTDIDGGPKTITAKTNGAHGTVVITGGGSGLTYQPAANYCNNPPGSSLDTFTYTLNGGSSATVSVRVDCINDAPVVTTSAGTTAFTEGGGPVTVDGGVTVTDIDNATLASATVTIGNLLDAGQEILAATPSGAILSGDISYAAPTLTITHAGGAPLADFQAVLRSVTYNNASTTPSTTDRSISFQVNDGAASSAASTKTVLITAVPIAFVQDLGQAVTFATSTTFFTTAAVAAGDSIIVFVVTGGTGAITCSDSVNGAYTIDVLHSGFPPTAVCSKHGVQVTPAGTAITITPSGNTFVLARAAEFAGLAATGAPDRTAEAAGTSASPAVTLGAATTQADELLVAAVARDNLATGGTAFSPGTNGTANVCSTTGTTTYSALPALAFNVDEELLYPLYCIVAATGTYGATGTFDASANWVAALATYRGR